MKKHHSVLSSNDFSVYNFMAAQQKCLAHIHRHFLQLKWDRERETGNSLIPRN